MSLKVWRPITARERVENFCPFTGKTSPLPQKVTRHNAIITRIRSDGRITGDIWSDDLADMYKSVGLHGTGWTTGLAVLGIMSPDERTIEHHHPLDFVPDEHQMDRHHAPHLVEFVPHPRGPYVREDEETGAQERGYYVQQANDDEYPINFAPHLDEEGEQIEPSQFAHHHDHPPLKHAELFYEEPFEVELSRRLREKGASSP